MVAGLSDSGAPQKGLYVVSESIVLRRANGAREKCMRKFVLSCAALALHGSYAVPAMADSINLKYTTFGGNSASAEVSPPTIDMGTATTNGQSATLTSNNSETGAVWMDTSLSSNADFVSLKFDIDVNSQATSGYDQTCSATRRRWVAFASCRMASLPRAFS